MSKTGAIQGVAYTPKNERERKRQGSDTNWEFLERAQKSVPSSTNDQTMSSKSLSSTYFSTLSAEVDHSQFKIVLSNPSIYLWSCNFSNSNLSATSFLLHQLRLLFFLLLLLLVLFMFNN